MSMKSLKEAFENDFPYYWTGSQVSVFLDTIYIDELTMIGWREVRSDAPLYAYNSEEFDAIAKGTFRVEGKLAMNFKSMGELEYMVNLAAERRSTIERTAEVPFPALGRTSSLLSPQSPVIGGYQNGEAIYNNATMNRAYFDKFKMTVSDKGQSAVRTAMRDFIWGSKTTQIHGKNIGDFLTSRYFNLIIVYGNPNDGNHTVETIVNVKIIDVQKQIENDGTPIQAIFSFIARSANKPITGYAPQNLAAATVEGIENTFISVPAMMEYVRDLTQLLVHKNVVDRSLDLDTLDTVVSGSMWGVDPSIGCPQILEPGSTFEMGPTMLAHTYLSGDQPIGFEAPFAYSKTNTQVSANNIVALQGYANYRINPADDVPVGVSIMFDETYSDGLSLMPKQTPGMVSIESGLTRISNVVSEIGSSAENVFPDLFPNFKFESIYTEENQGNIELDMVLKSSIEQTKTIGFDTKDLEKTYFEVNNEGMSLPILNEGTDNVVTGYTQFSYMIFKQYRDYLLEYFIEWAKLYGTELSSTDLPDDGLRSRSDDNGAVSVVSVPYIYTNFNELFDVFWDFISEQTCVRGAGQVDVYPVNHEEGNPAYNNSTSYLNDSSITSDQIWNHDGKYLYFPPLVEFKKNISIMDEPEGQASLLEFPYNMYVGLEHIDNYILTGPAHWLSNQYLNKDEYRYQWDFEPNTVLPTVTKSSEEFRPVKLTPSLMASFATSKNVNLIDTTNYDNSYANNVIILNMNISNPLEPTVIGCKHAVGFHLDPKHENLMKKWGFTIEDIDGVIHTSEPDYDLSADGLPKSSEKFIYIDGYDEIGFGTLPVPVPTTLIQSGIQLDINKTYKFKGRYTQEDEGGDRGPFNSNELEFEVQMWLDNVTFEAITFEYDKWDITPEGIDILDTLIVPAVNAVYKSTNLKNAKIIIIGRTSTEGTIEHNFDLGKNRALSVKEYIETHVAEKSDLASKNLVTISLGEHFPKVDDWNDTSNRPTNRRVDFMLVKHVADMPQEIKDRIDADLDRIPCLPCHEPVDGRSNPSEYLDYDNNAGTLEDLNRTKVTGYHELRP